MHRITVTGHEPGDYLHPDQRLEVVDEATGRKYELYVRSNAMAPAGTGEISLFVPVAGIREIKSDAEYCVVTLAFPGTEKEANERRQLLAGTCIGPSGQGSVMARTTKRRPRPGTRRGAGGKVKV